MKDTYATLTHYHYTKKLPCWEFFVLSYLFFLGVRFLINQYAPYAMATITTRTISQLPMPPFNRLPTLLTDACCADGGTGVAGGGASTTVGTSVGLTVGGTGVTVVFGGITLTAGGATTVGATIETAT